MQSEESSNRGLEDLRRRLRDVASNGAPQVAALARWSLDHTQELAFHSVRGLANQANVNANTVVRLAHSLGFAGFDECRASFQAAFREAIPGYGGRAALLRSNSQKPLTGYIRDTGVSNVQALFTGVMPAQISHAVDLLMDAQNVHCIGVRSCFSVAHYFSYTGSMAFEKFAPSPTAPGAILDSIVDCGPRDVVVIATYSHYSSEAVRAHAMARRRGARIIAMTDSHASPIADGAEITFCLPMDGPQPLPSLSAYILLAETLVATMIARSDGASERIARFEARRLEGGAYINGRAER